jgi:hypothetical protein
MPPWTTPQISSSIIISMLRIAHIIINIYMLRSSAEDATKTPFNHRYGFRV